MKKTILSIALVSLLGVTGVYASTSTAASASSVVSTASAAPVNINTADVATLMKVKHVTHKRAEAIVNYRTKHGDFKSVDDLIHVPGIHKKTLDSIKSSLTV